MCLSTSFAAAALSAALAASRSGSPAASLAYVVPDDSEIACDAACINEVAAKVRGRRGVRKASIEGRSVVLEIEPGAFNSADVIRGILGMKVELRVPYRSVEIRFVAAAPFPPVARQEGDMLVVEIGDDVKKAVEAAVSFQLIQRMKCQGALTSPEANEVILQRFEAERRPLTTMVPFMAAADLDGDGRLDLYLRFEGMPEVVVFNRKSGLKAVVLGHDPIESLPRCDASPARFARAVQSRKVRCAEEKKHVGDAVERVQHSLSSNLLLWTGSGFDTCEPLPEGAARSLAPLKKQKKRHLEDDEP